MLWIGVSVFWIKVMYGVMIIFVFGMYFENNFWFFGWNVIRVFIYEIFKNMIC